MENASVQSPCNGFCCINKENSLCFGCFRTLDEITQWYKLPQIEKERIINKAEERRKIFAKN